jgi:hypothetical protein
VFGGGGGESDASIFSIRIDILPDPGADISWKELAPPPPAWTRTGEDSFNIKLALGRNDRRLCFQLWA